MITDFSEAVFESDSKLKSIGISALGESGIKSIRIPNNVKKIGKDCFCICELLSEVTFGNSSSIGNEAFGDCLLVRVNIVKGVIWEYKFPECCAIREIDLNEDE
jgi:hypothetical protein